jgi:hypothetical protein
MSVDMSVHFLGASSRRGARGLGPVGREAIGTLMSASPNQRVVVVTPLREAPEPSARGADAHHRSARTLNPLGPDRDFEMTAHRVTDVTPLAVRSS